MWVVGHPNGIPIKIEYGTASQDNVVGVHVLQSSSGSMAVAEGDTSDVWEVVGVIWTGYYVVDAGCINPGEPRCRREKFDIPAYATLTPAYLAANYIP